MTRIDYILFGTAGVVAAGFGLSYLLKLNRLSNELETQTKATIHKINLLGIELVINVKLKNPSGGTVRIKHPFVKIIYAMNTIASSTVKNTDITIPKFSEQELEPIQLTLGFTNLATTVPALLREYRQQGKLTLTVDTITTINDKLPYRKRDYITLGSGKPA